MQKRSGEKIHPRRGTLDGGSKRFQKGAIDAAE